MARSRGEHAQQNGAADDAGAERDVDQRLSWPVGKVGWFIITCHEQA